VKNMEKGKTLNLYFIPFVVILGSILPLPNFFGDF